MNDNLKPIVPGKYSTEFQHTRSLNTYYYKHGKRCANGLLDDYLLYMFCWYAVNHFLWYSITLRWNGFTTPCCRQTKKYQCHFNKKSVFYTNKSDKYIGYEFLMYFTFRFLLFKLLLNHCSAILLFRQIHHNTMILLNMIQILRVIFYLLLLKT